jgi:4-amino-4-deoxy-L-arabinose transferase-like glycosyltransferase
LLLLAIVIAMVVVGCLIGLMTERVGWLERFWWVGAVLAVGAAFFVPWLALEAWQEEDSTSEEKHRPVGACGILHEDRRLPRDVRRELRDVCPESANR